MNMFIKFSKLASGWLITVNFLIASSFIYYPISETNHGSKQPYSGNLGRVATGFWIFNFLNDSREADKDDRLDESGDDPIFLLLNLFTTRRGDGSFDLEEDLN